jgi:hypothetical protein
MSVYLLVIAFGLLFLGLNVRHRKAARPSRPPNGGTGGSSLEDLLRRRRSVPGKDDLGAIPGMTLMLVKPARYITRTVESISLQGLAIEKRIAMEFAFPQENLTTEEVSPDVNEL